MDWVASHSPLLLTYMFVRAISVMRHLLLPVRLHNFREVNKCNVSVTGMLQDLKWNALETMRRYARSATLFVIYKMCYGFVDGKWEDYLIPNRERRKRGSHDFKFIVLKGHKNIFRFSFFPRTITKWNKLLKKTVTS